MIKQIIVLSLLAVLVSPLPGKGCDLCGCGVGSFYMGITPQFARNFAGIRYRYAAYDSHVRYNPVFRTSETFNAVEFWARFYPVKRVQVLTFLPYAYNQHLENGQVRTLQGMSDAMLIANYDLINTTRDTTARSLRHQLLLGGGVKLPTGKYDYKPDDPAQVANPNFQLGTGSTDFLLTLNYILRRGRWGLNTDAALKLNTTNRNQYQFGHRITANLNLFYVRKWQRINWMPYTGIYVENALQDRRNALRVEATGGMLLNHSVGLDLYYRRYALGANLQTPMAQDLADGQIFAHQRVVAHLSVMF